MRAYLGVDIWVRRILGATVLLGVLTIALGWDRGLLTRLSRVRTESLEQRLVGWLHPQKAIPAAGGESFSQGPLAALSGAAAWINSSPLTPAMLRGKVVLVDFWTYSCINCLRSLPYVKAWADKYKNDGLVVIGVHTPEFAFEKEVDNVQRAVRELGITYPVAVDSRYAIWNAFGNQYWPAHYFIDAKGRIRHHHFGEGEYEESERVIQRLLAEGNAKPATAGLARVQAEGAQAGASARVDSPETYIGYGRSENQVGSPPVRHDQEETYKLPGRLALNQWGLEGRWNVQEEKAALVRAPGKICFRFRARDLHLVLGPGKNGTPIHFVVRLGGAPPGADHGEDADASGRGQVREQRLYQLIRQRTRSRERTFEIEFLDPGLEAFAFTFG
jgi:thiol-disulfide isomerase/thioredoxin